MLRTFTLVSCAMMAAASVPSPSRVLMFSNTEILGSKHSYITTSQAPASIAQTLDSFMNVAPSPFDVSLILYVSEGSADLSLTPIIQTHMTKIASSSLAAPFVYKASEEDSLDEKLFAINKPRTILPEDLVAATNTLNNNDNLFMRLRADQLQGVDKILGGVLDALAASGKTYFVTVAEEPQSLMPLESANYGRMLTEEEGTEFSDYYNGKYLYLTPELMAGILTGIFFSVVVLIGLSCLNEIMTPDEWAKDKIPLGKEY